MVMVNWFYYGNARSKYIIKKLEPVWSLSKTRPLIAV